MDLDISALPLLQRQSIRDLKRNHDALRREVSALVALNAALVQDLRVERQEALEILRKRDASRKDSDPKFPIGDQALHSAKTYGEALHQVQCDIEALETTIETFQTKVAALHLTRESLEDANVRSRLLYYFDQLFVTRHADLRREQLACSVTGHAAF
ncbi:hypothetical protein PENSPDRAFT_693462 [Peniophora sp. CONT]|nr:hypothetical protein PENSPDRAFT_693462 [Peniophora sp. CONT]